MTLFDLYFTLRSVSKFHKKLLLLTLFSYNYLERGKEGKKRGNMDMRVVVEFKKDSLGLISIDFASSIIRRKKKFKEKNL